MALQFKNKPQPPQQAQIPVNMPTLQAPQPQGPRHEPVMVGVPGLPIGMPPFLDFNRLHINTIQERMVPPPLQMPGADLPRAINFAADLGGCYWWRLGMPEILLNLKQKAIIHSMTMMITDPRYLQGYHTVKLQRQATPHQLMYVKFLQDVVKQCGLKKLIFEIDDVVFKEDIPMFNRCREAFDNEEVRTCIMEMMKMSDEITVTCDYMRDYYIEKTGNKKITVIPNYPMRMWADRFYDEKRLAMNFEKNKKKPRIAAFISGTHIDVVNKTNQSDDYTHLVQAIIRARKDFEFSFCGAFPLPIKPYIDMGEIKFIDWFPLPDFPKGMYETGVNVCFAALQDNHFNRSKSDIKLVEAACIGYPCVCQDMVTYKNALLKFNTGDEFIDQIKKVTKNVDTYMDYCKKSRAYADTMWLDNENNLMKHHEAMFTDFGSSQRKYLLETNPK